jgi:hypothetical protein
MKPGSTWSPFQSPEVREIGAHFTPEEREKLIRHAEDNGAELGIRLAFPAALTGMSFAYSWRIGSVLLIVYIIYFLAIGIRRLRGIRQRMSQLLCEPEWARSHGYTPNKLRLMTFPWTSQR